MWGHDQRSKQCQKYIMQYLSIIESVVEEGIQKGEIANANPETISSEIFSTTCTSLLYRIKHGKDVSINELYKELEKILFRGILN